jgi:hypothetical protein
LNRHHASSSYKQVGRSDEGSNHISAAAYENREKVIKYFISEYGPHVRRLKGVRGNPAKFSSSQLLGILTSAAIVI